MCVDSLCLFYQCLSVFIRIFPAKGEGTAANRVVNESRAGLCRLTGDGSLSLWERVRVRGIWVARTRCYPACARGRGPRTGALRPSGGIPQQYRFCTAFVGQNLLLSMSQQQISLGQGEKAHFFSRRMDRALP